MKLRKIDSTALIGAMLFFAPSTIPAPVRAQSLAGPRGRRILSGWLSMDIAFAGIPIRTPPCPVGHSHTPVWPGVVIGCAASIVLSALVANFRDNRQLTTQEASSCGLLYWIPLPCLAKPTLHAKG